MPESAELRTNHIVAIVAGLWQQAPPHQLFAKNPTASTYKQKSLLPLSCQAPRRLGRPSAVGRACLKAVAALQQRVVCAGTDV